MILVAIMVASGIVSWSLQHLAAENSRATNQTFQRQAAELAQLQEQNAHTANLISLASNSSSLPEDQLRELLRARNEVGQLRSKSRQINQLRATNQALLATLPNPENTATTPARWSRNELADIGYADPESAIISTLWTLQNTRANNAELLNPSSATGISLAGKKFTSPDDATIDLYYEGENKTRKFSMQRVGGVWQLHDLISITAN